MELPAWAGVDGLPAVLTVVLEAGDVGTEEGSKLPSTAGTLTLVTHLVVQHIGLHLHLKHTHINNYFYAGDSRQ